MPKSVRAQFWWKIHFCPDLGKKGPPKQVFCICWKCCIVSSRVGDTHTHTHTHTPFLGTLPLSEANLKSYPPLSENHPKWCMLIVRNTLKMKLLIKSIENIINITFLLSGSILYLLLTLSLVRYCL